MVLIKSNDYAEVKQMIKQAMKTCGDTTGQQREDDERLSKLDKLLADIDLKLYPATDER